MTYFFLTRAMGTWEKNIIFGSVSARMSKSSEKIRFKSPRLSIRNVVFFKDRNEISHVGHDYSVKFI